MTFRVLGAWALYGFRGSVLGLVTIGALGVYDFWGFEGLRTF